MNPPNRNISLWPGLGLEPRHLSPSGSCQRVVSEDQTLPADARRIVCTSFRTTMLGPFLPEHSRQTAGGVPYANSGYRHNRRRHHRVQHCIPSDRCWLQKRSRHRAGNGTRQGIHRQEYGRGACAVLDTSEHPDVALLDSLLRQLRGSHRASFRLPAAGLLVLCDQRQAHGAFERELHKAGSDGIEGSPATHGG